MVRHLHISRLDQVQASSDIWANTLITRNALFFNDVCLRHNGELRAYFLIPDRLPSFLQQKGGFELIPNGKCIDYLEHAQSVDAAWTIHELFPEHFWHEDFQEVPLGNDTWQPKIDLLQAQIDALDSTYASDAEMVAAFAQQITAAGDVFALIDAKVLVETQRAGAAESANAASIVSEQGRAEAAELVLTNAVSAEASTSRAAESANAASIVSEQGSRRGCRSSF